MVAATTNFGVSFALECVGLVLVAWFAIKKFPGPMIGTLMRDKLAEVRGQLAAGEEATAAAAALLSERRAAVEAARAEAASIVDQARHGAELVREASGSQADEEYERIVRRAADAIEGARLAARAEITAQVGRLVYAAARDVIAAELDDPAQRRLIDEAIRATEAEVG
jgi:F-type H+-transporting ATPase subunit b